MAVRARNRIILPRHRETLSLPAIVPPYIVVDGKKHKHESNNGAACQRRDGRNAAFKTGAFQFSPPVASVLRSVRVHVQDGAGDGNRTHVARLEVWNSTIELRPQTHRIIINKPNLSIRAPDKAYPIQGLGNRCSFSAIQLSSWIRWAMQSWMKIQERFLWTHLAI